MPKRAIHYGDRHDETHTPCGRLIAERIQSTWNMDMVTCKRCLAAWAKWCRENP